MLNLLYHVFNQKIFLILLFIYKKYFFFCKLMLELLILLIINNFNYVKVIIYNTSNNFRNVFKYYAINNIRIDLIFNVFSCSIF